MITALEIVFICILHNARDIGELAPRIIAKFDIKKQFMVNAIAAWWRKYPTPDNDTTC